MIIIIDERTINTVPKDWFEHTKKYIKKGSNVTIDLTNVSRITKKAKIVLHEMQRIYNVKFIGNIRVANLLSLKKKKQS